MTITLNEDPVVHAEHELLENLSACGRAETHLAQALDALGAARVAGASLAIPRQRVDALRHELEERRASQPHHEGAVRSAKAVRDAQLLATKRQRLCELAAERLDVAAGIDLAVSQLAAFTERQVRLNDEAQALLAQLNRPAANGLTVRIATALVHNLASRLQAIAGRDAPATIVPSYTGSWADVLAVEFLSSEEA